MPGLWDQFRSSSLWRGLRHIAPLRSALYFAIELKRTLATPESANADFERRHDPWHYDSSPLELDRFQRQLTLLASVARHFPRTLEIGCAEGRFTQSLVEISSELSVLDVSELALQRARARIAWAPTVTFELGDLRTADLAKNCDLIVATGILEYFPDAKTLRHVIRKLGRALAPGGYLLLESTRAAQPAEEAFWWPLMPRGRRINQLVGQHPDLTEVAQDLTPDFAITLFRKRS